MSHAVLADWLAIVLWGALAGFAVMAGADFGAGVWDLLAHGRTGPQQRGALIRAIGPIWEGNEIWLIFLITGTWTGFPLAFMTIMTALFIPLTIGLLGTVMRGAAFAYYSHFRAAIPVREGWGRAFSVASVVAPFVFGASAAAAASGHIRVTASGRVIANPITTWTTPFALCVGCAYVALCATLAAVFMTVEVRNQEDVQLLHIFRRRAFITGGITLCLGLLSAWLASFFAPYLFSGLTTRGLWLALCSIAAALATGAALLIGLYRVARVLVVGMAALAIGAWTVAQLPYMVVPDVRIETGAAPSGVLTVMLLASIVSAVLVGPPYVYLLYIFKARHRPRPPTSAHDLIEELEREARFAEIPRRLGPTPTGEAEAERTLAKGRDRHRPGFGGRAAMLLAEGTALVAVPAMLEFIRRKRRHQEHR